MNCPACNAWTQQLETRQRQAGTYRRYECGNLHRFSTLNGVVQRVFMAKQPAGRPKGSK